MPVLNTVGITLADAAKAHDPSGRKYQIFDTIRRRQMVFDNMVWKEANQPDKHIVVRRTGVATPQLGRMYKGVLSSTLKSEQVPEYMAMVEDRTIVDVRMKEFHPNINELRQDIDVAKLGDIVADSARRIFYGNRATDIDDIDGLAVRMAKTSGNKSVVKVTTGAAADGAASSIYFVNWNKNRVHGIYPKGSDYGAKIEELTTSPIGNRVTDPENGGAYQAYESGISHRIGLAVIDPLGIGRIGNINAAAADPFFASADGAVFNLINFIKNVMKSDGALHVYLSELLYTKLENGLQAKGNFNYTRDKDDFGKDIINFAGLSWHVTDQLVDTEKVIV